MFLPLLVQLLSPPPIDLLTTYDPAPGDKVAITRVATAQQWERRRADIQRRVEDFLGKGPVATMNPRITSREDLGGYARLHVLYGDVTAYLLMPKGKGPYPAVLAAHPTYDSGKNSVVGLSEKPSMHYAKELVERGFVVLAPDSVTAGERVLAGAKPYVTDAFDRRNPEWSAMGKMLSDHRLGIDYLLTLPEVDKTRIAAIGHSLGGYNAFFLAAFDERVKAAVSSCGFTMMAGTTRPFAWSRTSWFVHFPKLQRYLRSGIVPFDFHEVLAMVAPRALFNYSARADTIFPDPEAIEKAGNAVSDVYRMLGAAGKYEFVMGEGPHDFPGEVRVRAYTWMEQQLKKPGVERPGR